MLLAPPERRFPRLTARTFGLSASVAGLLCWGGCKASPPLARRAAPVRVVLGLNVPGPLPASLGMASIISGLTNERLLTIGREGRPEPALAERWEQAEGGLTWRLVLRPNLQFHDGTPLDAFRVAASLAPEPGADLSSAGLPEGTTVRAEDATTLVFRLRKPSSLFIEYLATLSITSGGPKPASAGPFRIESREPAHVRLRAFPGFYRGQPNVDGVDVIAYPNARNAWSAMMRGEVDVLWDVTPEAVDFIEQSSRANVHTFLRRYVYTMAMNVRHPALRHPDVRVALNNAANRTQIIERVFRGRGYPASSHVWPKHWAYDHTLPRFRFTPDDAARRLDAAGFPVKRVPSGRQQVRFSFICLVPDADVRYERIALHLQQQLFDVGVDMQLQSVSVRETVTRLAKGDYDAVLLDMISTDGLGYVDRIWHSTGGRPVYLLDSGYTAADPALDQLRQATTDDDVRRAVHALQKVLHDDPPAIFICWAETSRAVNDRFRIPHVKDADILRTLPDWKPVPSASAGTP